MYRFQLKNRPSNCLYVEFLCDAEDDLRDTFEQLGQETEITMDQVLVTHEFLRTLPDFEGF
jgi:hypothetical protein